MKKIWRYLAHHVQQDFHPVVYVVVALFLAQSLYVNYTIDFEDGFLDQQKGFTKFAGFFLFFATGYGFVLTAYALTGRGEGFWRKKEFWIKSVSGLSLLALDSSVPFLRPALDAWVQPALQFWAYKISVNVIILFLVTLPLLTYYYLHDRHEGHVYGLRPQHFDTRPYFIMLAIMLPVVVGASFHGSFIRQYPMYRGGGAAGHMGVAEWVTAVPYELAYGLDFATVEFFFRGFMVIGMMRVLGRKAVLAMAVIYCFLHFGKPAGEAISSIVGGYVLGVIAYDTRSIWGGIIVHLGIAWLMECMGYLQKYVF